MTHIDILHAAKETVADRALRYGDPWDDFNRIALILNGLGYKRRNAPQGDYALGTLGRLEAEDVPRIMICVKLARSMQKFDIDHLIDIVGYVLCWQHIRDKFEEFLKPEPEEDLF